MKKFIQICSLLSLVVVFTAAAASAKVPSGTEYGSQVEIPFSFNVADKAFEAGTYNVKLKKLESGAATLMIENVKSGEAQMVIVTSRGGRSSEDVKLVFETIGGTKYLATIKTDTDTFAIARPRSNRKAGVSIGSRASLF